MLTKQTISALVRGAYDLQALRIQMGGRLCANFRAKLSVSEPVPEGSDPADELVREELIKLLKASYVRITDGIAADLPMTKRKKFIGDEIISEFAEYILAKTYFELEAKEVEQFKAIGKTIEDHPLWAKWLVAQKGVGPAMGSVLLAYFDPHKADTISKFWAYAGLSVAPDGRAISRRAEHLVTRTYTRRDGTMGEKQSIVYEPWLRARLLGVLAPVFLKVGSPWRKCYDDYKHRLTTDQMRIKSTDKTYAELVKEHGEQAVWSLGRIHKAAMRYMIKQFLAAMWLEWRKIEGLPVTESYNEARRGREHGAIR